MAISGRNAEKGEGLPRFARREFFRLARAAPAMWTSVSLHNICMLLAILSLTFSQICKTYEKVRLRPPPNRWA